jgi:ribosomal protein L22
MSPRKPDEGEKAEVEAKKRRLRRKKADATAAEPVAEPERDEAQDAPEPVAEAPVADEPVAEEPAAAAKPKTAAAKPAAAKAEAADDAEPKPKARRTRRKAEPEAPAAPARKRAPRDYGDTPPMVRAHAKYVRTSARKARLVCDHIRGKSVDEARAILAHANRDVARDWSKLLESAVANAEHNHELIGDELRIHAVKADEGPTLKRFRPRAMGRATKIRKRTSHLSITLTPKDGER